MDELNHDFQALALEGRAMGEVRLQVDGRDNDLCDHVDLITHLIIKSAILMFKLGI